MGGDEEPAAAPPPQAPPPPPPRAVPGEMEGVLRGELVHDHFIARTPIRHAVARENPGDVAVANIVLIGLSDSGKTELVKQLVATTSGVLNAVNNPGLRTVGDPHCYRLVPDFAPGRRIENVHINLFDTEGIDPQGTPAENIGPIINGLIGSPLPMTAEPPGLNQHPYRNIAHHVLLVMDTPTMQEVLNRPNSRVAQAAIHLVAEVARRASESRISWNFVVTKCDAVQNFPRESLMFQPWGIVDGRPNPETGLVQFTARFDLALGNAHRQRKFFTGFFGEHFDAIRFTENDARHQACRLTLFSSVSHAYVASRGARNLVPRPAAARERERDAPAEGDEEPAARRRRRQDE